MCCVFVYSIRYQERKAYRSLLEKPGEKRLLEICGVW
jgi:hypothetical protein